MARFPLLCLVAWLWVTPSPSATGQSATAGSSPPDTSELVSHAPYCLPEACQLGRTVTLGTLSSSGTAAVKQIFGRVVYSAKQQKILEDNDFDGGGQFVRRILDYPARILYTIKGDVTQTCTKTPLLGPFALQCVPGNSTVLQTNTTYGVDQNAVSVMELSGIQHGVNYRVTITRDTYVPVYEQFWGKRRGEDFFEALSFYNATISSEIPASVFKPPAVCDHVLLSSVIGRSLHNEERPLLLFP